MMHPTPTAPTQYLPADLSRRLRLWLVSWLMLVALTGCTSLTRVTPTIGSLQVSLAVDGKQTPLQMSPGSTVQTALDQAKITLSGLDRVAPPSYTVLTSGVIVKVVRVREVFTTQQSVIPFERQTVQNESLPDGQTLLVQSGTNGVQEVTYRQVLEDGQEVSNTAFKTEITTEPLPEIVMVGVQKPFSPIDIPGRLAYLAGGNAWMMEKSTGNRRPLVTTGDLDGQIFSLSPKGDWLLFTRKEKDSAATKIINTLWVLHLTEEGARPLNLKVNNIKWFADWAPGREQTIAYSTVEPRAQSPGWQANNDLHLLTFGPTGASIKTEDILPTNAGGMYGWWGPSFAWSPDGALLAYSRPDSVGILDMEKKQLVSLAEITPYQTGSDWAWVSGLGWSSNHRVLYFVTHAPKAGLDNQDTSPLFDLSALAINPPDVKANKGYTAGDVIPVVPQAGMFAYPVPSPLEGANSYQVAYLQAIYPEQSQNKRYRLVVMDRDGSNPQTLFPPTDHQGLDAQRVVWSPKPFASDHLWISMVYQGNLWLMDSVNGQIQQITGDGLINRIDWK